MARSRSRGWARGVYLSSGLAFAGALGGLGFQMQAGVDPSLGAVPVAAPRPHLIVTKKIIRTTVVTTRIVRPAPTVVAVAAAAPAVAQSAAPVQARVVQQQAAPVVRVTAPVARVAAPAPAPAAPAAPATRAS